MSCVWCLSDILILNMPRNDEGEFELVLGNRQLLSGFFIVVILFGVFFTMGYIVGRHSSPTPTASPSAAAGSSAVAQVQTPTSPTSSASLPPGEIEVLPATKAATESGAPAPTAVETIAATSRPVAGETDGGLGAPETGKLYVQVRVGTRPALSGVVDALQRKGIPAFLAPGPDSNSVRVLVGPFDDQPAMAKARAEVQDAGFKDAFPKRY